MGNYYPGQCQGERKKQIRIEQLDKDSENYNNYLFDSFLTLLKQPIPSQIILNIEGMSAI